MNAATDIRRNNMLDRHALEQIVARCSDGVVLVDACDPQLPVVHVNPTFEALTGYAAEEVVGLPWGPLQREDDGQPGLASVRAAMGSREAVEADLPDVKKDGTIWLSHVSVSPLHDARGQLRHFLILQREGAAAATENESLEVTLLRRELGRARQKIDHLNRIDPATGLLRYEHFVDVLNRDLAVARRDRRPVCVLLFEIVELDVYRNTFGAKAAESCMRMIGAQISGTLRRAGDLCARYGDAVVVASILGQEVAQAALLTAKIAANVEGLKLHNPHAKAGRFISIASAVAGGVPGPGDDAETFVERAQRELRAAQAAAAQKKTAIRDLPVTTPITGVG